MRRILNTECWASPASPEFVPPVRRRFVPRRYWRRSLDVCCEVSHKHLHQLRSSWWSGEAQVHRGQLLPFQSCPIPRTYQRSLPSLLFACWHQWCSDSKVRCRCRRHLIFPSSCCRRELLPFRGVPKNTFDTFHTSGWYVRFVLHPTPDTNIMFLDTLSRRKWLFP